MKLEEKWELNYNLLEEYKKEYGNIDVPTLYVIEDIQLGRWLNTQRNMYKDGKLSEERINKLNELGMNWNIIDKYYVLLEEYKKEHGNIDVPTYYEIDGIQLGQWVRRMRAKYNLNKLDNINIEKLNNLGMSWKIKNKISCGRYYDLLVKYKKEYGNIDVPLPYEVDGYKLGQWVANQRSLYNHNKLSKEKIEQLESLGIKWNLKNKISWDEYYNLLIEYKEEYGNTNVPSLYEVNGTKLGSWVTNQRKAYNGEEHRIITPEQIIKLNEIDFDWSTKDTKLLKAKIKNNEKYQLILYKRMRNILRDLQLENINEIHNEEEQKEIEKIITKRLFR